MSVEMTNFFDDEPLFSMNDLGGLWSIRPKIDEYIKVNIENAWMFN